MKKTLILLSAFTIFVLAACQKEENNPITDTPPANMEPRATIIADPHHMWGTEPFELGQTYNVNGTDIQIDEFRFYLSNFKAMPLQGDGVDLGGVILVDASSEDMLTIAGTDETFIHDFEFYLGLDYDTNHADPTLAEAPLNNPGMHWSWNPDAGYKFIKIEGKSDVDGDGIFEPFSIHAATDAVQRTIIQTVMLDVAEGNNMVHMKMDYQAALAGVDFTSLSATHGASDLTNGIADAFGATALDFE